MVFFLQTTEILFSGIFTVDYKSNYAPQRYGRDNKKTRY